MPRRVAITPEQEGWLQTNHHTATFVEIADQLGCCVDTAKRILQRMGLRDFDAAKYQTPVKTETKRWSRPCIECGSQQERPKSWYFCGPCRRKRGFEDY